MKASIRCAAFLAGVSVLFPLAAQEQANIAPTEPAASPANAATAAPVAPAKSPSLFRLSDGAASVLKLKRGNVTDDVILAFVNNRRFALSAEDVVALHQEGVSDPVITAMLQHSSTARPMPAAPTAIAQTAPAPESQPAPAAQQQVVIPGTQAPSVTYVQSTPTYVAAPAPAPVYVYQDPVYSYSYYDPFWPVSFGFRYPGVSFRYGYGGYRPAFHGGFYGGHSYSRVGVGIGFRGGSSFHGGFHGGFGGGGFHHR